jgi:hypothetical protein
VNVRTGGSHLNSEVQNAYAIFLKRFSQNGEAAVNYVLLMKQFDGSHFPQHTWPVRSALYLLLIDPYFVMFVIKQI